MAPKEFPHKEAYDACGPLPELVAAITAGDLKTQLIHMAEWWREQLPAKAVAVGLLSGSGTLLQVGLARQQQETRWVSIERCRAQRKTSLQEQIAASLGRPACDVWIPLADAGQVIGGIAILQAGGMLSPPPPLWSDITSRLLAQMRKAEQELRDRKIRALGEFAAGAGHEIHNPLATIVGRAEMLLREENRPAQRQALAVIGAQALRVRDMIGDLRLFAHPVIPEPEPLMLRPHIERVVEQLQPILQQHEVELEILTDDALQVLADKAQFSVVLSELLRNAVQVVPPSGQITIEARQADGGSFVELLVHDNGPGLSAEEQEHMFDPFYSARQAGRGLGFGLCKCWRILEQHGGCIHVESSAAGTTMILHWPQPSSAAS